MSTQHKVCGRDQSQFNEGDACTRHYCSHCLSHFCVVLRWAYFSNQMKLIKKFSPSCSVVYVTTIPQFFMHFFIPIFHAFLRSKCGYRHLRYNDNRGATSKFLADVCHDVEIEPLPQLLQGASSDNKSIRREEEARLVAKANGLYGHSITRSFSEVKYFNPLAKTSRTSPDHYKCHENMKKLNISNAFWMSNRAAPFN